MVSFALMPVTFDDYWVISKFAQSQPPTKKSELERKEILSLDKSFTLISLAKL